MEEPIKVFKRRKNEWKAAVVCFLIAAVLPAILYLGRSNKDVQRFRDFAVLAMSLSALVGIIIFIRWLFILLKRESIKFYPSYMEIQKGRKSFTVTFASFDLHNWVYLEDPDQGSSLWTEMYYKAIEKKGLCLKFDKTIMALEKLQKGVYDALKENLGDLAPAKILRVRTLESDVHNLALLFPKIDCYVGKDGLGKCKAGKAKEDVRVPLAKFRIEDEERLSLRLSKLQRMLVASVYK